jgi:membrane protein
MSPRQAWSILVDTIKSWLEDKVPRLGAALAYYSVFSIAPLLIIVIAVAGFVFGNEAAQGRIVHEIKDTLGSATAQAIQAMIANSRQTGKGLLAAVVGLVVLLVGASGVFGQLQDALNTIWKVAPRPGRGIRGILRDRFLSFTMVLATGFLLLVSLAITAALAALAEWTSALPGEFYVWQVVNSAVSLALITLLFAFIFKVLPDVKIGLGDVWIGAAVTALLFVIGKHLIGVYLARSSVTSVFGAAGSLVVLLLWVYFSSQILLFGAEFTKAYATRHGRQIMPTENAISLTALSSPQKLDGRETVRQPLHRP